jgi:glycosyltransferase involved in cell wall biosynthesis
MRVALVLAEGYPPGTAAAKRVQAFAVGLQLNGIEVVVIGAPPRGLPNGAPQRGVDCSGVPYLLAVDDRQVGDSRWKRFLRRPGVLQRAVAAELKETHADIVLIYGHWWYLNQAVHRWCRRQRLPVVADCTEWWRFNLEACYAYLDTLLFRRLLFPRVSGIVAISRVWEEHAHRSNVPVVRIPSLIIPGAAVEQQPTHNTSSHFVLTYVGAMYRRDLPLTLLAGLSEAVRRGVDVRLVVIGQTDLFPSAKQARALVQATPELYSRVEFTGRVSNEELKQRLIATHALVLLRADDHVSRACFPTRLPEFLLSGRPLITSAVGDVTIYLKHLRDAWLVAPGDHPASLADAIETLARDPALARRIGMAGGVTAMDKFAAKPHMQRLKHFLEQFAATS